MIARMESEEIVVLDFETTGMSADDSRVIEVGAARVVNGRITETYSTLCDPGEHIPYFITNLTGITNAMVRGQPAPESVMAEFQHFLGDSPVLAHNASFDRRFLVAEMKRIGHTVENPFLCSMLLARRLIQESEDHKLGTLRRYIGFQGESDHTEHRALDDVKVTVALWNYIRTIVQEKAGCENPSISLLQKIARMPKHLVEERLCALV
jgi:DNA polymerase-3 subunit epsilon